MTLVIGFVLALLVVQTLSPPFFRYAFNPAPQATLRNAAGPRDVAPPHTLLSARLDRARLNLHESLFLFVPLSLLLILQERETGTAMAGAWLFVAMRVLYVPVYALGARYIRPLVFIASVFGLAQMASQVRWHSPF